MSHATRAERPSPPQAPATTEESPADTVVAQEVAPGDIVGDYRVDEVIGSGTFGVVVRATHTTLGREAAIKVLKRAWAGDEHIHARFVAEARAVNRIRHPNIVDVYGFGQLPDGREYFVMDLLRGQSLAERLSGGARVPWQEALALLRPLADALAAAHAHGITHRDLKPENVFVCEGRIAPEPKLLDFGVARVPRDLSPDAPKTRAGMVVGTPCYMAPEQALGEPVDARTDVFALGVLAYQMLTGRLPWEGRSLTEVVRAQLHGAPPKPPSTYAEGLPEAVDGALAWMLRPDVRTRCPDMKTAVAALEGRVLPPPEEVSAPTVQARGPSRAEVAPPAAPSLPSLSSLSRLAEEEERSERSGLGRIVFALGVGIALFAGGLWALDQNAAAKDTVEFQFEGQPQNAEVLVNGSVVGHVPGAVSVRRRDLPATFEVRAAGFRAEKRDLGSNSVKLQWVTLTPDHGR